MTHYWIQTWQGICVYYITRHQAHLSFITYIPPPHQEREKGEWEREKEGQCESHLKLHTEAAFYARSGWYSARHRFPSFFLFCPRHWEPVKYNNTGVHPGTPKTILPTGIFGEILETHHRAHPTLLSSQTDGTVWTDFRIMQLYGCRYLFPPDLMVITKLIQSSSSYYVFWIRPVYV